MRNSLRNGIVVVALCTAALAVAPAAGAADPVYGVSTDRTLRSKDLVAIERGGINVLRLEISWRKTKGKGGALSWRRTDKAVRRAAEHGIRVVPYLTGSPRWIKAGGPDPNPATDGWLQFVSGAVDRYGPGGSLWPIARGAEQISNPIEAWQVWNTANRKGRHSSPKSYGELLEATHRAITLADPGAEVLTGAMSFAGGKRTPKPTKFLRGLLRSDGKRSFSAVGASPQSRSVGKVQSQLKSLRRILDRADHGSDAIWVTPIGWASDRRSSKAMAVGRGGQKKRLKQVMKRLRQGLGVEGVFWSRWRDGGGGCKWCRHSGLVSKRGKSKPAWKAYKKFLKKLGTQPPPPPPPKGDPYFLGMVPDGQLANRDLAMMEGVGVGAVRLTINWQQVASSSGFDWRKTDEQFRQLASHGIEVLPQLFGNPQYVQATVDSSGPVDVPRPGVMDQWKGFVTAAVDRYKPGSPFWRGFEAFYPDPAKPPRVWQVYNEQNIHAFWPSGPSPNKYAELLHASAEAIDDADPTAKVMLGGMHGDDNMNGIPSYDFLRGLYVYQQAKGWEDDFDIVAVHPYAFSTHDITTEIDQVRAAMDDKGDTAAPIWVSEMGWASSFDDDDTKTQWWERTEQGQARMLTQAWNLMLQKRNAWNLEGVFWYTWRDPLGQPCTFCGAAGLLKRNFVPKPSFQAFQRIADAGSG